MGFFIDLLCNKYDSNGSIRLANKDKLEWPKTIRINNKWPYIKVKNFDYQFRGYFRKSRKGINVERLLEVKLF